ncbi:helix-turn-helix domain-containing protein [Tenacibaculum geojense]|uniref:Helix-turn-helix domain-containing protein n=1 Tax=Tenacibaculum geojense TaxID=915352 RepID=A0ABW3JN40_9FLAO
MKPYSFYILNLLFFIFFKITYSQNDIKKDSLIKLSYDELSNGFYDNYGTSGNGKKFALAYIKKSIADKDTLKIYYGNKFLSLQTNNDVFINKAGNLAIDFFEKTKNKKIAINILLDRSEYFLQKNKTSKSLLDALKAKKILSKYKNDSLEALTKIYIAFCKSDIGKENEALQLMKSANKYILRCNNFHKNNLFASLQINIPLRYMKLKQYDSAHIYNNKAYNLFKKIDYSVFINIISFIRAKINYESKNFHKTIIDLNSSIKNIKADKNYKNLIDAYCMLGYSHNKTNNKLASLKFNLLADSLHNIYKINNPKLESVFNSLIIYYKNKKNLKKQLYYTNKLIKFKETDYLNVQQITKNLSENYDKPKLIEERNKIVAKLKQEALFNKLWYAISILIVISVLLYQIYRKKKYKKQFLKIVNQEKLAQTENIKNSSTSLSEEIVQDLSQKLIEFEKNNSFLNKNLNLKSLADDFNTNSNYLSKVINQTKNQSFSNYVNQLRISYAVNQLKKDTLLRKYTIKAIASEVGFKNPESFSKAFYKFTNLKPSYFIKQLNEKS